MTARTTKFYQFRQNNSGGSFHRDASVDVSVIVEAVDAKHANAAAMEYGVYFDGCDTGQDCSCCGDRWDRAYHDDEGKPEPCIYDDPVAKHDFKTWHGNGAYVYYLDGRKEHYGEPITKRKGD